MKHVVMFSSGVSSALAASRVLENHKATLLFTDTQFEDADNYRFIGDVLQYFMSEYGPDKYEYVHLKEGRNPLQIFQDQGVLGCDRIPVCSRMLKGEQTVKWLKEQVEPIKLYFGFDYKELHRADRVTWKTQKLDG